ncbi:MAG: hypothetical protein ACI85S_000522, partial [Pseudohongiellaceae bacterium]
AMIKLFSLILQVLSVLLQQVRNSQKQITLK